MSIEPGETYLGDAVYASYDGYQLKLRTGDSNDQVIYLDGSTYHALTQFVKSLHSKETPNVP